MFGEENHDSCASCRGFYAQAGGLVLRHYHDPICARRFKNVMFIPMGVSEGIGGVTIRDATLGKPGSTRRYAWSFASNHRNAARDQIAAFARRSQTAKEMERLLSYPGTDPDYISTLADSAFVRVPSLVLFSPFSSLGDFHAHLTVPVPGCSRSFI